MADRQAQKIANLSDVAPVGAANDKSGGLMKKLFGRS